MKYTEEQYTKEIEQQKEFINLFEKLNKEKEITRAQPKEDYKRAKEFIKLNFKDWLKYKGSIINVRGLKF